MTRPLRKEVEGGCGVVGAASSVPISGRSFYQSLAQMANRGNGKGGGVAVVGLDPSFFGTTAQVLRDDYLLAIAYLDPAARPEVEREFVEPVFEVDHTFDVPTEPGELSGVRPPDATCYFVRVRRDARAEGETDDDVVFRNTFRLNTAFYASTGEKRAFVLSHGKDLLVLKLVGYGDDVIRHYRLGDLQANVWIGHHRYPTKGTVWHPGGAHPFIGLNEALVHNGDFANYASIVSYLAQRERHPLFLTDTEVAVLVFDLLHREYGYPLEYVIEALAPTTDRDFSLLPEDKREIYRMLQTTHIHGSPDGPWFFLIAQSAPAANAKRLIGITDTSMLRPQVFAMQNGRAQIGVAASEKQAIDALLDSLSQEDERFWNRADLYWNARGGSHTDGGAFIFTVGQNNGSHTVVCTDKFGREIRPDATKVAPDAGAGSSQAERARALAQTDLDAETLFDAVRERLSSWDYGDLQEFLAALEGSASGDDDRDRAFHVLGRLTDARYATGGMKRSAVVSLLDRTLANVVEGIRLKKSDRYVWTAHGETPPRIEGPWTTVVIDAREAPAEGESSLARKIVELVEGGAQSIIVANARGQRFIGCGLGTATSGVRIDVYGSSGDYLGSGIDGAEIAVHGSGQDQLAQIMKAGRLIVHGDVGQTFGYAAKGGDIYILGNAAGRPMINAVGRPHVVINGTALDYLAESFMAGDPLDDGGFVIVNGMGFDENGNLVELAEPYPGCNLFSLASGGAIYVRDPQGRLDEDQLNAGEFAPLGPRDWEVIMPYLEENERLFGIRLAELLSVDGAARAPDRIYRKIRPAAHHALTPEEAWVSHPEEE